MKIHTIDLQFQGHPNAIASFLVEGSGGAVLIETGPESTLEAQKAGITAAGFSPEEIAAVFVTHVHLDHAGAAGWWAACGVPVFVHHRGAKHLLDPSRLVESARAVYGGQFEALWGGMTAAPSGQVHEISDGDVTRIAGLEIEAVETPGHAFHHHAFRVGDSIFTGDSAGAKLSASDHLSVTSAPPQFHLEHTLASIERIASLKPRALYLTHFGTISEVSAHLEGYRDAVELNAEFVRQRIAEGMDPESIQVAYQAFQMEQAFREEFPRDRWEALQVTNGAAMCADGIRLYWERKDRES